MSIQPSRLFGRLLIWFGKFLHILVCIIVPSNFLINSIFIFLYRFNTMDDFVTYGSKDEEFHLPGTIDLKEFEAGERNL